jgi:glycopeptide antibiotics resistance protein
MISLLTHALLGILTVAWLVASNRAIFSRPQGGPWFSPLELVYYTVGIASIVLGWYFNIKFVAEGHGQGNLVSGPASYPHFLRSQFASSAAGSGISDYLIANVILLPLFTIVDGLRRGIRHPWLYFLSSFFTSFSFPLAFYFATIERQRRHAQARETVDA